jgi:hypothetical protein
MPATSWSMLFQGRRAAHTLLLILGIGVPGTGLFIITTILPSVVADLGGAEFYAWPTALYTVAAILGTASSRYIKATLGFRHGTWWVPWSSWWVRWGAPSPPTCSSWWAHAPFRAGVGACSTAYATPSSARSIRRTFGRGRSRCSTGRGAPPRFWGLWWEGCSPNTCPEGGCQGFLNVAQDHSARLCMSDEPRWWSAWR